MDGKRISTVTKLVAGCAIAACTAFIPAANAQVGFGITIGTPPPPLRYEAPPPAPGPGLTWVDGYWGIQRGRYVWMPGRWERPPYPGAYWSHPHWDHYDGGWQLEQGHWDREDHGDHHDWNRDRDRGRGHDDGDRH